LVVEVATAFVAALLIGISGGITLGLVGSAERRRTVAVSLMPTS
jgi:hypothetical protein